MLVGLVSTLLLLILLYGSDWHTFSSLLKQKSLKASPPRPTMAVSMRDVDPAFQGAGQKEHLPLKMLLSGKISIIGLVKIPVRMRLVQLQSRLELDAALGGRAVQYREVQGNETEKFLSYFKPCIIPEEGGVASGFRHAEVNAQEHVTRLFVCRGKYTVHVKEVPFARSSLNHEDIFILDTESKIFQFNGSNSSIQERAKALEVVQYLKDTNHEGKCDVVAVAFLGEERKKMKTLIAPPVLLTVTAVALYLII